MENNFEQFKPQTFYMLEPHKDWVREGSGVIAIEPLVERVYGKEYSSLRGYQQVNEDPRNDTYYTMFIERDFEDLIESFDNNEDVPVGHNEYTSDTYYRSGMTPLEYWLSIKVDPGNPDAVHNPSYDTDLTTVVFKEHFYAERRYTVPLDLILADLIRRGELPMGNYIFKHWW